MRLWAVFSLTLRLLTGSWAFWGRVSALGARSLRVPGGSWDLVSKVLSTLIGVISSSYKYSYPNYNPSY